MQMILDSRLMRCNSRLSLKNLLNFPNSTCPLVDKHGPNGQMVFLFGVIDESDDTVFIFCPSFQKLGSISSLLVSCLVSMSQ